LVVATADRMPNATALPTANRLAAFALELFFPFSPAGLLFYSDFCPLTIDTDTDIGDWCAA
jgi:hypothetical protein